MSYAIVRNEKLTRAEVNGKGTHNDRKAKNHTNKDIDPTKTHLNYYIKKNELTYTKEFDLDWDYKKKIKKLEKENHHLHKIIDKFYETIDNFIKWICHKFSIGESKQLIKDFEKTTNTFIDPVKQLECEEREKEWDLEL